MANLYNSYDEYKKANQQTGAGQSRMSEAQWNAAKKAQGETVPEKNNDPNKGYKQATADKLREQADKKDAGQFAGLTASDRTANEDRQTADALDKNNTTDTMKGDSRYAGKETPKEEDTWQTRIKNGKASDDDMKTAYEMWKKGKYSPGPKTLEYFKLNFEGGEKAPEQTEIKDAVEETVNNMGGTKEEAQSLWQKLKGKLTNKQLEEYAKQNGISYGQALAYTIGSYFKGRANDLSAYTGVKPFSDEETLSPLEKRYRVTSGKVDEQESRAKESEAKTRNATTNKTAAINEADIAGTSSAQEDISSKWWTTKNGQTLLDFAQLNADIKNIEDTQALTTLEKKLGLERSSAMALQKFLSDLAVDQNYAVGLNAIQLKTDEVQKLANLLNEHPNAVEGYKSFLRKQTEGGISTANAAKQWVDLVLDPVTDIAGTAANLVGAANPIK
ncbi:MAG: hypothetical protein MJ181_10030 [Treponema sp.]|nr:hypothetical protein [Treponema sp.]